jgi:Flp pilus assembly protein TadD
MRNGRNKDAITQFQLTLRKFPNNPSVLNNLATLYQTENDKRALATAEQALKLAPASPAVQDTLGWILVEQGQISRGLSLLRKALAHAPKAASIRYHHAVALTRTGEKAQARKDLEQLLKDSPNFTEHEAARSLLKNL